MNLENYKILKLSNKEMIVCEVSGETKDNYEISNPLKMDVVPKLNSSGQINEILNLRPWLQHCGDEAILSPTDDSSDEDVYDELLMDAETESKLIH